jgi:hypothetical protein
MTDRTIAKKEFLEALESYITARIEQHEHHGSTVPYAMFDRWQNSKLNLSLAVDGLIDARQS